MRLPGSYLFSFTVFLSKLLILLIYNRLLRSQSRLPHLDSSKKGSNEQPQGEVWFDHYYLLNLFTFLQLNYMYDNGSRCQVTTTPTTTPTTSPRHHVWTTTDHRWTRTMDHHHQFTTPTTIATTKPLATTSTNLTTTKATVATRQHMRLPSSRWRTINGGSRRMYVSSSGMYFYFYIFFSTNDFIK